MKLLHQRSLLGALSIMGVLAAIPAQAFETFLQTKFGTLSVDEEHVLHFNGKPVTPGVMGNSSLYIGPAYQVGNKILAMTINMGGTACPELFNIITISQNKAVSSPTFGTCQEPSSVQLVNQSLIVEMPDQQGIVHKYVFAEGALTENGKVVADQFSSKPFSVTAIINDPDGYTNVRKAADGKSPIVARVNHSVMFSTHVQPSDWWQVRVYPDIQGYIHKSRVLMIRDF